MPIPCYKVRAKLQADLNASAMIIKRAIDDLELAKRPLLQQISARLADKIENLEAQSSELRDRVRGLSKSAPGGLDDLVLKASQMVRGWAPSPVDDPQINSPRYRAMLAWAAAYRAS